MALSTSPPATVASSPRPENSTVGLPPTPDDTYVGANTAVVPDPQLGLAPVPPETTVWPAVVGTHSHPGVTAANALPTPTTSVPGTAAVAAPLESLPISPYPFRSLPRPVQGVLGKRNLSLEPFGCRWDDSHPRLITEKRHSLRQCRLAFDNCGCWAGSDR